jgi:hypothetical protein
MLYRAVSLLLEKLMYDVALLALFQRLSEQCFVCFQYVRQIITHAALSLLNSWVGPFKLPSVGKAFVVGFTAGGLFYKEGKPPQLRPIQTPHEIVRINPCFFSQFSEFLVS